MTGARGDQPREPERRGRGRHAAPVAVGRMPIVVRTLVCLTLVLAGVLLTASPREEPGIVDTAPPAPSQGIAVIGAGLIALGWVPIADLLIRGRHDVRRVAGAWPARTAPVAAVLSPVMVILGCLRGVTWPPGPASPAGGGVLVVVLLLVLQGWALAALWRRPGAQPASLQGSALRRPGGE